MSTFRNNSSFSLESGIFNRYEKSDLFDPIVQKEKKRKKNFLKMSRFFDDNIFIPEFPLSNEKENKIIKKDNLLERLKKWEINDELNNSDNCFSDMFFINHFVKQNNLETKYGPDIGEFLKESGKKIKNFFSNILNYFSSKNEEKEKIKIILKMDKETIEKKISENTIKIPPKKYDMIEGTGKCLYVVFIFFCLFFQFYLIKILLSTTKLNKKKYESISFFDSEILNKIKTNNDIINLGKEVLDDLSLRMFKFADLGYKIRKKEEENIFPESFMNWEIINYKLIGKDNSFYVLKDTKNKKLIVTFPGTNILSSQLIEEILGSSLINFHKNYTDILISRYFGERISEIFNYIFTPEINTLLENNYQIISTGHSLGGAIAQAFIYFSIIEKKINKKNSPMTITFNQPRVGNKIFAEFLDKNAINLRYTKGSDIVSSIPFSNFDFVDICKYIIKKRNIHNEYVHTHNEINITDGIYIYSFISVIILALTIILLFIFIRVIQNFLSDQYKSNRSIKKIMDITIPLIIVFSMLITGFLGYSLLLFIIKYKTYKMLIIVIFLIFPFVFYFLITIIPLIILLVFEIIVFIYNYLIVKFLNSYNHRKEKVKLNTTKFKNASLEEKYLIITAFIYLCFSSFASFILDKLIFSHMKTAQRDGKEQFYYNGTQLNYMVEKIDECNSEKEIGFEIFDKFSGMEKIEINY